MELRLRLTLPSNPTEGFGLNYYSYEPKEVVVSDLWFNGPCYASWYQDINDINNKKQVLDKPLRIAAMPWTLHLLLWNNHPNEEDEPEDPKKL